MAPVKSARSSSRSSGRPSARDRILAAAADLFYQEGIQNVGIDRIIATSGVAKMSLYNHFKSKDALVAAWLQQRDEAWRSWFQGRVEALATSPSDRLLVIFDALGEWFAQSDFRGCAFLNTTVELADPAHPGCQVAAAHQQAVADYLLDLVEQADLPEPQAIAQQLLILIEGAIVTALAQRSPAPAQQAKQVAEVLLASKQF